MRSPTAEQVFAEWPGVETCSAGTNNDAENPLTDELVEWADSIFVMEREHRTKVQIRHRRALDGKRLVVLGIPDDYGFMDDKLVALLKAKMGPWLPAPTP